MNCTHGGEPMSIALGATCPWCNEIVAERHHSLATAAERVEASPAPPLPAAAIAAPPVIPSRPIAAAPEVAPPASGAPTENPAHVAGEREQPTRPMAAVARECLPQGSPGGFSAPGAPIAASAPKVASVPSVAISAGQSASGLPPVRRTGADAAEPIKHARNTDPDTARDAALSVNDAHKRRLYDHILALIFEHGPLTDWQLAQKLTQRLGEPIIATSAGKRRGELRDMGLVYDTGFRGPTETGPKKAVRWGLTPAGEMEVAA